MRYEDDLQCPFCAKKIDGENFLDVYEGMDLLKCDHCEKYFFINFINLKKDFLPEYYIMVNPDGKREDNYVYDFYDLNYNYMGRNSKGHYNAIISPNGIVYRG